MANLRKGSRGDEVKELQTLLNSSGNTHNKEAIYYGESEKRKQGRRGQGAADAA
nr:MAG TPA: hypothetical protein [Podoviridae sp. ctJ6o53]